MEDKDRNLVDNAPKFKTKVGNRNKRLNFGGNAP